jgi:membrane protease YdiL (CAAX protease family)
MSVRKASKVRNQYQSKGTHTKASFLLSIMAITIMTYLGIRHVLGLGFEIEWGKFALVQGLAWGMIGLFGTQLIKQEPIIPKIFKRFDINTGLFALIVLGIAMVTQVVTQYVFTISNTEQALYYVFSAVCEELFFRLFLIELILQLSQELSTKIFAVITESLAFMLVHQNYYNNPGMMAGVFLGGCVFGAAYVWKRDITICILAHFSLNLIATANWLVKMSSETQNTILVVITIVLPVIIYWLLNSIRKMIEEIREKRENNAYVK